MSASFDGSVTQWISGLKLGDSEAAQKLWERYFQSTVRMARARLRAARHLGSVNDEEDAALSVLNGVFDGLFRWKFPQLADRDGLWRLLVVVTVRKASSQARDARRLKRGWGPRPHRGRPRRRGRRDVRRGPPRWGDRCRP